jgi:hypothetical protein
MALEIVWRNPQPPIRIKQAVQRIRDDESCVVYVVTDLGHTRVFRLISKKVA